MKKLLAVLSLLLITAMSFYSFYGLTPGYKRGSSIPETEFSTDRALIPLKQISKKPHYLGSPAHAEVRIFLISELEKLGLKAEVQEGFSFNSQSKTLNKPKNIVARIEGSEDGKALLILTHYDSALVPSFGASDAGSGLVTILESLRAYKASGKIPKNDIIVLFTDAEEIGLDGAKLFVNKHPWAKDVGLALNFEARGSSGPSNMIVETNQGNSNLIKEFIRANPDFPVASSLMYSVYKMLPNDTDSTIFREDGDIDSYFFAFIDSHYNYHTANDTFENLDRKSLAHQGSYLLPLLHYFADANLSKIKSKSDNVYVNLPIIKMISYPFSWILPMLLFAVIIFIALVFYGVKRRKLNPKLVLKGFIPHLLSLTICGLLGFFGWKGILTLYPHYLEIQQGFTYNGHWYIAFFVFLSLGISFKIYKNFSLPYNQASFYVAPLFFWLLINVVVFVVLKGAAFFIIPVFFALLSFWVMMRQQKPNLLAMALLAAPAIFIFVPLIQFFPVGLGLKMLVISCVFTVLMFGLLWPVFGYYKFKNTLSIVCIGLSVFFFVKAHIINGFSEDRKSPNSLIYYLDANKDKTYFTTFDKELDLWTKHFFDKKPLDASHYLEDASYSNYGINYTFAAEAPKKDIPSFDIVLKQDTIIDDLRHAEFIIIPKRKVNKIELYNTEGTVFERISFNGQEVVMEGNSKTYRGTSNPALVNYFVSDMDSLEVSLTLKKDQPLGFRVMEYYFDLMSNPQFSLPERPNFTMPKPFVLTDAILVKRNFSLDTIKVNSQKHISEDSKKHLYEK